MILSGDIGGTKTNLAYFESRDGALVPAFIQSYQSKQYRSLNEVIAVLRRERPEEIRAAAFGIAGPVVDGRSRLTNLGWEVVATDIAAELGLRSVGLLNDLEATAYGVLRLGKSDLITLQEGVAHTNGAIAVLAAGTGLGEGGLFWDGRRYRAIPSEGGHADFAPRNELEMDLLRFLLKRYGRVSYERLVAGPGILNIYQFLRSRAAAPEPSWLRERCASGDPSAAISEAGMGNKDPVCAQTLEVFVSLYGAEAGNLALKLLATGGVYVGGGIAPKILPKILSGAFMDSFCSKGRYESLLRQLPVHVVVNDKTALLGAAHYAELTHDEG